MRASDDDLRLVPMSPRERRALFIGRLVSRAYATIIATLLAITGAVSVAVAAVMIAAGVVLDTLRARYAFDEAADDASLSRQFRRSPEGRAERTAAQWIALVLCALWWGYVISFAVVEPLVSDESLAGYLHIFSPVADLVRSFAPVINRHVADLVAHGYGRRALIVEHIYALGYVFFVALVIWSLFWVRPTKQSFSLKVMNNARDRRMTIVTGALIIVGLQIVLSYILRIDWYPDYSSARNWGPGILLGYYVQWTNLHLLIFTFLLFGEFMFIGGLRVLLILFRTRRFLDSSLFNAREPDFPRKAELRSGRAGETNSNDGGKDV